jgi:hypothetical protein
VASNQSFESGGLAQSDQHTSDAAAAFVLIEASSDVVAKNIFRAKMDNASNVAQAIVAYCDYKEDVRRGAFPVSNWAHCASKAIKQELSHQRIVQFRS